MVGGQRERKVVVTVGLYIIQLMFLGGPPIKLSDLGIAYTGLYCDESLI